LSENFKNQQKEKIMSDIYQNVLDNEEIAEYIPKNNEAGSESVEDQARALGWKPEEEYTGKPEKWTDAEKFLEVHGKNNGALRKALEKQAAELLELKKQMGGLDAAHKKIFDIQIKKAKEEFDQQIAFLKAQRKEAVRSGEYDAVDELDEQIEKAKLRGPDIPEIETPKQPQQQDWRENPILVKWAEKNTWFEKDEDMSLYAGTLGVQIRKDNPSISFQEVLDRVEERVKKAFPHKFKSGEDRASRVEGSSTSSQNKGEVGTYASLNKAEKEACDEAVEAGMKQKDWLKLYFGYDDRRKK